MSIITAEQLDTHTWQYSSATAVAVVEWHGTTVELVEIACSERGTREGERLFRHLAAHTKKMGAVQITGSIWQSHVYLVEWYTRLGARVNLATFTFEVSTAALCAA